MGKVSLAKGSNVYNPVDLGNIRDEYNRLGQPLINFFTRLQEIDDWYYQRDQADPFIEILDADGVNTVRQIASNEIRVWGERLIAYITPEDTTVEVSPLYNPRADGDCLQHIKNAIEYTWYWNDVHSFGSLLTRRLSDIVMRGQYIAQYSWLDPLDADVKLGGFPIKLTLHDIFNTRWELDANSTVTKVLLAKKRYAASVYPAWLEATGETYDPTDELEIYEYWDQFNHGVVIGQTVVKDLTPHKYLTVDGMPLCPFVIATHLEHDERQSNAAPQFSGTGVSSARVGTPVVEALLPVVRNKSKLLTALFEWHRRTAIPVLHVQDTIGREVSEIANAVEEGILTTAKDGKAEWMPTPQSGGQIAATLDYFDKTQVGTAGASSAMLTGQMPSGISGLGASQMTNMARSVAMLTAKTLSTGLTREAQIIAGLIKGNTKASTARNYFALTGYALKGGTPGDYTNGKPLAHASAMTGGDAEPIDPLTFTGFRVVKVSVVPEEHEPAALLRTAGLQLLSMPQARMPLAHIYGEFFKIPNPEKLVAALDKESILRDPSLPFQKINGLMELLTDMANQLDPQMVQQAKDQLSQALPQIVQQALQKLLAAATVNPTGPPGQNGQAPGGSPGPAGAPPPGPGVVNAPPPGPPQGAPGQNNLPPPTPGQGNLNQLVAQGAPPQIPPPTVGGVRPAVPGLPGPQTLMPGQLPPGMR